MNHADRLSSMISTTHREALEQFICSFRFNPIDAHSAMGLAIHDVANEHLTKGKEADYQPDQDYSSREVIGFLAKMMFKPEHYQQFIDGLDQQAEQVDSHQARVKAERTQAAEAAQTGLAK